MSVDAIREIVHPYPAVLETLLDLDRLGARVVGWKAWIRHADGHIEHSRLPIGCDVSGAAVPEAAMARCIATIEDAQRRWHTRPEVPEAELLFCVNFVPPLSTVRDD